MKRVDEAGSIFVFTIAARNYLGQVSVLFNSVRERCGNIKFCCFVVDGFDDSSEIPSLLEGHVFDCRHLGVAHFEEMAFKYDVVEFCTALKPYVFEHIFESTEFTRAVYFDPDIKLYGDLTWLEELFTSKSIVVTPHVLDMEASKSDGRAKPPALHIGSFLSVGTFNFGFVAVRRDSAGISFVRWWADILRDKCFIEASQGLFVDQKWADFLPSFFGEELEILRDPGANVAYWNIHERNLIRDSELNYRINGSPLKFVHYSSIDLEDEYGISSNIPKAMNINLTTYPEYRELFLTYKSELVGSGHKERKTTIPYRFNFFDDKLRINKLHRRIYAKLAAEEGMQRPFSVSGGYYYLLKKKGLLEREFALGDVRASDVPNLNRKRKLIEFAFRIAFRVLGTKYYLPLLNELRRITNLETNTFLIR